MNKRAQGLSINVIIIVAIALIVLVVLIAVFTGRMGSFVGGVDETTTCDNTCAALGMSKAVSAELAGDTACKAAEDHRYIGGGTEKFRDLTGTQKCCCKP